MKSNDLQGHLECYIYWVNWDHTAPQAYFSLPLSPQVYRAIALLLFCWFIGQRGLKISCTKTQTLPNLRLPTSSDNGGRRRAAGWGDCGDDGERESQKTKTWINVINFSILHALRIIWLNLTCRNYKLIRRRRQQLQWRLWKDATISILLFELAAYAFGISMIYLLLIWQ